MSLSKLTKMVVSTLDGAAAKKVAKVASNSVSGVEKSAEFSPKKIQSYLDALAQQGKAITKKSKINPSAQQEKAITKIAEQGNVATVVSKFNPTDCEELARDLASVRKIPDLEVAARNLAYGIKDATYKSAQDSAEYFKAQFAFDDMMEPFLSHKSARNSAMIFEDAHDEKVYKLKKRLQEKYADKMPQIKQRQLKARLAKEYGEKLAQRQSEALAKSISRK